MFALLLAFIFSISGIGCHRQTDPFSFSFTWGICGYSSYDSETGRLVKTTDTTHPDDYVTTLVFSEKDLSEIRRRMEALDLASYPDTFDPCSAPGAEYLVASMPDRTLILSVRIGDLEKKIVSAGICYGVLREGYNEKATAYLNFCRWLEELITGTDERKALPEYERFYE